jgi:hypothetical protein
MFLFPSFQVAHGYGIMLRGGGGGGGSLTSLSLSMCTAQSTYI